MIDAYNETLVFTLETAISVFDVIEIEPAQCDDQVNTFMTTASVTVNVTDDSEATLQRVGQQFLVSYNTLSQRFCDPLFRTITNITLVSQQGRRILDEDKQAPKEQYGRQKGHDKGEASTGQDVFDQQDRDLQVNGFLAPSSSPSMAPSQRPPPTRRIVLFFRVTGSCRGCPFNTRLFNDAIRRLSDKEKMTIDESMASERRHYRFLQGATCYCSAVNVVKGAPSEREFFARYGSDVTMLARAGDIEGFSSINGIEGADGADGAAEEPPPEECVSDDECFFADRGDLCIAGQCITNGNLRFTLTWDGDDDLDLIVITPFGNSISGEDDYDSETRGTFETRFVQTADRQHVESVFFPDQGLVPSGKYIIRVDDFEVRNAVDSWTLEIFEEGFSVRSILGIGQGLDIEYEARDGVIPPCDLDYDECCSDADCVSSGFGSVCTGHFCVEEGFPRVTLTYFGGTYQSDGV